MILRTKKSGVVPERASEGGRAAKRSAKAGAQRTSLGWRDPNFQVTPNSTWQAIFWQFEPLHGGIRKPSITWDFLLVDGRRSTDDLHKELLESFKEVLWGMLTRESFWGAPLSVSSVGRMSVGIRELFQWMVFKGYKSFADLTNVVQSQYVEDLSYILTNRSTFYQSDVLYDPEDYLDDSTLPNYDELRATYISTRRIVKQDDESWPLGGGGEFEGGSVGGEDDADEIDCAYSYHQASLRVNTIYYIYAQKAALHEKNFAIYDGAPFGGSPSQKVSGRIATYVVNRLPPLPDEVALPIVQTAIRWIEERADDIAELQRLYLHYRELEVKAGMSKQSRNASLKALHDFQFSLSKDGMPWRGPIVGESLYNFEYGEVYLDTHQLMRTLLFRTRDAAMILLLYLVGLRTGELCSIEVSPTDGNLPSCVEMRLSRDGLLELFFVKAIQTKGLAMPQERTWLIGCRPSGSIELPLVVKAISMVERLFAHWREISDSNRLFLTFSQPKALPNSGSNVRPIQSDVANAGLRTFIYHEVDLSGLPDTNRAGEELWKYRDSKGLNIRNLHWRKTFAAYILEARSSLLPAVAMHFKHLNDAMTESAYFPAVHRLRQDADAARAAETINWFSRAIEGVTLRGSMADLIDEWFDAEGLRKMSQADRERAITKVVLTHDLRIFFSGHGACFIKARPLESRCRQATGTAGWSATTPDYSARTPSMCGGCGCFAIDLTHLNYWEARESDSALALAQVPKNQLGEFRVLTARRNQAAQVLKLIRGASKHGK